MPASCCRQMVTAAASCWKPKHHSVFPKSFRNATVLILMIRWVSNAHAWLKIWLWHTPTHPPIILCPLVSNRGQHGFYSVWNPILRMLGRNHFLPRPGKSQLDRKRKVGSVLQLEKDMSRVMTPEGRTSRRSDAEEPPQKRSPSPWLLSPHVRLCHYISPHCFFVPPLTWVKKIYK